MALQVIAVGMLDVATVGKDSFFVRVGDEIHLYVAHRSGRVFRVAGRPIGEADLDASVERFRSGYRLETPLEIAALGELVGYLGRFELQPDGRCRLRGADAEVSVSGVR